MDPLDPVVVVIGFVLLALRGAIAVAIVSTLAGGVPRVVQIGLAVTFGAWSAIVVASPEAIARIGTDPRAIEIAMIAGRELVVGAAIGIVAVMPLVIAAMAGRLVDGVSGAAQAGPYAALFGVLAAAVFVGIDGHVTALTALVESHRALPAIADTQVRVLDAIGGLLGSAARLAVPWLVTAAVVEIAVGIGSRLAARAAFAVPGAAAVPAALVMMTATLVGTLAIAIAQLVRQGLQ